MATTNNSKSFFDLPVTTQLVYLVIELYVLVFFLIFNPLTLFVLNIFKPAWANDFAHSDELYSERCQKFFTRQAKKWPWHWAKWWYTLEELKHLPEKRQIDYYNNVNFSDETLVAMRADVAAKVLDDDFTFFKDNLGSIKQNPELFRLFIAKCLEQQDWSVLEDYLKGGTLPKEMVVVLANEACHWSIVLSCGWRNGHITGVFLDYVERCGLSNEMRQKIGHDKEMWCDSDFEKELQKRLNIYDQRVFTESQRGTKQTDAWLAFCETTKEICPQAQMEMGLDQYHVFHKTGHTLDAEAILHILSHNSDRMMAQLIFEYEPNYGIVSDDIKEFLDKNLVLRGLRDSVIENHPDDLQRRMYGNEKLTEEELSKVFDYPNAGQLIFNYVTRYPLPENLHKRMLELPERAHACILMYYHNEVSPQEWCLGKFHLADDVRREAERRGWIPEKED